MLIFRSVFDDSMIDILFSVVIDRNMFGYKWSWG